MTSNAVIELLSGKPDIRTVAHAGSVIHWRTRHTGCEWGITHMARPLKHQVTSEGVFAGGRRVTLSFKVGDGDAVPSVLLLPAGATRAPAALLLHGYSSRKEQMAESVGRALLRAGVASLAIDLPLHGDRESRLNDRTMHNPLVLVQRWKEALADCSAGLRYLAARPEVDATRLSIAGYSMGSFLGVLTAAREPSVNALVLAAGGDLPDDTPFERLVRQVADPLKAIRKYAGRPVLMIHGTRDRTVTPAQAQRLFDAASEPKELNWIDSGHRLPDSAIASGADWLAAQLMRIRAEAK